MKGHTTIPFARQTAALIAHPSPFEPDFKRDDMRFWGRTFHFETRYRSIDKLLEGLPVDNVLELSAGFSFRGLDLVQRRPLHYIDTDLPDMIAKKKAIINVLDQEQKPRKGTLELLPLNALDEAAFKTVVARFPPGPVAIINEGLLVYLNLEEKQMLCKIIRDVLQERGGYWITGDIYVKVAGLNIEMGLDESTKRFFEEHNVENNRFDSIEAAEAFFRQMGFVIDEEAVVDPKGMSTFPYVMKYATPEAVARMRAAGKIHCSWRLKLAGDRR